MVDGGGSAAGTGRGAVLAQLVRTLEAAAGSADAAVLAAALEVPEVDATGIYLLQDDGGIALLQQRGFSAPLAARAARLAPASPQARLVQTGQTLYMHNRELAQLGLDVFPAEEGIRAFAVLALSARGRPFGSLNVASTHADAFAPESRRRLELLADLAGPLVVPSWPERDAKPLHALRSVTDGLEELLLVFSTTGQLVAANAAACARLGCDRDTLRRHTWGELLGEPLPAPDAAGDAGLPWQGCLSRRGAERLRCHGKLRRGAWGSLEAWLLIARPLDGEAGELQARLQRTESTLRGLMRSASAAIHVYRRRPDGEPVLEECNDAGAQLCGRPAADLLGRSAGQVLRDPHLADDPGPLAAAVAAARDARLTVTREGEGDPRAAHDVVVTPLTPDQTAVLFFDITTRVRAERERERLRTQVSRAERMETIGQFAGGIAHDFNNLLTGILGYATLIEQLRPEGDPARLYAAEIQNVGRQASALVRQILAFSRHQVITPEVIDLNPLLRDRLALIQRLVGERIRVRLELAPTVPATLADPVQLDQVLLNLAVNARDAMPGGGALVLRSAPAVGDRPGCVLEVGDNGVGVPPELQEMIFEPFFTTKEPTRGTGLGLSIVRSIVQQLGGEVSVRSAPGAGATFTVWLPPHAGPTKTSELPAAPAAPIGALTVLLVEDEPFVREMLAKLLERQGHRVLLAKSGDEAIATYVDHAAEIDLLLSDVVMPGMTGPELVDRLPARRPELTIIFMSGYPRDVVAPTQLTEGRALFLRKPFSAEELVEAIARARAHGLR